MLTDLVYSGGTSVQEYASSISQTNLQVEYIRGSDYGGGVGGILYTLRSSSGASTPSYTHANKRGDITGKADSSGNLTYVAQYQAFGDQVATYGTTLDRQKSNSKEQDPWGGHNEGVRYRDDFGFFTRDPAGMIDGPNEYTYVRQNPWTSFDPEGLATDDNNKAAPKPNFLARAGKTIEHFFTGKLGSKNGNEPGAQSAKATVDPSKVPQAKAVGKVDVDTDGDRNPDSTGYPHGDVHNQPIASGMMDKDGKIVPRYLPNGKINPAGVRELNADTDDYGVADKRLAKVNGGPLQPGDKEVETTPNGVTKVHPIGDFGPHKTGELSYKGVQNQGYHVIDDVHEKDGTEAEASKDGVHTPNIPARVYYIPNSSGK